MDTQETKVGIVSINFSGFAFSFAIGVALIMMVMMFACGTDSPAESSSSDGSVQESGESVDPNISPSDRIYGIDDLKSAGAKANKEYDVADLPGASSAWRVIFNRLDYEARFYPDHETAIEAGLEYANHVTGNDAVVIGDDVIWEEGAKDRRRCSRDPQTPHSGCAYSPRYWDFVVEGNMILMCEGLESPQSIANCEDLLSKIP